MSGKPNEDRNQEATVYMGNLDERCTDALIWELMLQAGPVGAYPFVLQASERLELTASPSAALCPAVLLSTCHSPPRPLPPTAVNVHLPKDRISMTHQGYGFCEFLTEEDADYACKIMNQIKLFGKPIRVNKASSDRKQLDIGANLFIGNLDPNVDERMLYDTFMAFGTLVQPAKISRDMTTGASKGFGFVSYDSFEAADAAIESMNNQFLANKPVTVGYAFKKDAKGERHGTPAERLLAAQARKNNAFPQAPPPPPMGMGMGMGGYPMGTGYAGMAAPPPPPPPAGFAQAYGGAPAAATGPVPSVRAADGARIRSSVVAGRASGPPREVLAGFFEDKSVR
ncbi:SPOSA6832_01563, partial [Sporobolomyces salmonicolor]